MEFSLDDLDNPDPVQKLKDLIYDINNRPKVTVDITGSETLFASIDAELHLKKHDTNRLLVFQSQCLSAINYLERLLIDYPIESEVIDGEKISKLSLKYKYLLDDIKGRIELYKNKDLIKVENPNITIPSVSNHLQLTNKEVSYRHYSEVFFKLMKAKNPSIMLNEIIDGGFKYISEDILDFIDKYIHEQRRFIVDLKQANPQSNPENIGIPQIKQEIEKAEIIRSLIASKPSFIQTQPLDQKLDSIHNDTIPTVTIPDRILLELNLIQAIYKAQFFVYDSNVYPYILNAKGISGIDGRYLEMFDIISNVELLNLHFYKQVFTDRYENTTNHELLFIQLFEIREKAIVVRDYFNENLTVNNPLIREYNENRDKLPFEESADLSDFHSAVVTVCDYHLGEIYLGCKDIEFNKGKIYKNYSFHYMSYNFLFAQFCEGLIAFIDKFSLAQKSKVESHSVSNPPASETTDIKKQYPEKWYAFLHMILINLSNENQFLDNTKKGIIDVGTKKYGTGQGFYREIKNIDLNNMTAYIKSMLPKDRKKWKSIIIELSGNDADVISWVNKQPK